MNTSSPICAHLTSQAHVLDLLISWVLVCGRRVAKGERWRKEAETVGDMELVYLVGVPSVCFSLAD